MMGFSWRQILGNKTGRDRVILHCDLNNFFASVAMLSDPTLRGRAVAVCGDPEQRKGIVLAKSEQAKKMGVKTGMVIWEAQRLCPELVIVGTDYAAYAAFSKKVQAIYYRYTNQVESFGIDECWLDVTGSQKMFGSGAAIADQIRQAVKNELGLTISVGVSFNKTYAKLGSDLAAPDAVVCVTRENCVRLVYPLAVNNLLFVGRQTEKVLAKLNIKTIGDLAGVDPAVLRPLLGINADKLVAEARGDDGSQVADYDHAETPKSVGNGTTLPYDLTTVTEVEQVLYLLTEKVVYRLHKSGLRGSTVSLSVKGVNLEWTGAQESLPQPTATVPTICRTAVALLPKIWPVSGGQITPVRALRVAVSNLVPAGMQQTDLFAGDAQTEERHEALAKVFDAVRRRYGTERIMYGGTAATYANFGVPLDFYECDDTLDLWSDETLPPHEENPE